MLDFDKLLTSNFINRIEGFIKHNRGEHYAGIGSRRILPVHFRLLTRISIFMAWRGRIFNSGGACGSDEAFQLGIELLCNEIKKYKPDFNDIDAKNYFQNIYVPWSGFRNLTLSVPGVILPPTDKNLVNQSLDITKDTHPNKNLSGPALNMMARNNFQALGDDLNSPVKCIICFTPDGAGSLIENSPESKIERSNITFKTGGTGQALRVANKYNIPIHNIGNDNTYQEWYQRLSDFDDKIFKLSFGITTEQLVNNYLDNYIGFENVVYDDLPQSIMQGKYNLDAMVHGCNCQCAMGLGIAKTVKQLFPKAYIEDKKTKKGDYKKLGTYTKVDYFDDNNKPITIINGYTQVRWGRKPIDNEPLSDYEKIRKLFVQINKDFKGKTIGIPKIGATNAHGEWYIIQRLIDESTPDVNIILFIYKQPQ